MKKIMPVLLVFVLLVAVAAISNGCKKKPETVVITEYDVLQKMFIGLSADTIADDVEKQITENELKYETKEYTGPHTLVYTIGEVYEEGERHPFKCDTVSVTFSTDTGSIKNATYTHGSAEAVLVCDGDYWDSSTDKTGTAENGYYGRDIIKHDYEKVSSVEDAIQYIYDHQG